MRNVLYLKYLPENVTDEFIIIMQKEFLQENQEFVKQGKPLDKIYILVSGKIELFLTIAGGDLYLDTLEESGCVLNQISILNQFKMTYSARAKTDVEVLTISLENLNKYREKNSMKALDQAINEFQEQYVKKKELHLKQ